MEASAPGKVILFGEHAVVHGKAAVAASIGLRTTARCVPLPQDKQVLELHLAEFDLVCTWSAAQVASVAVDTVTEAADSRGVKQATPEMVAALMPLVDQQLQQTAADEALSSRLSAALLAFLFLYTGMLRGCSVQVVVTSQLPVGAGLGSSAAYCVSLAAVLLSCAQSFSTDGEGNAMKGLTEMGSTQDKKATTKRMRLTPRNLELINAWAFQAERLLHGNPSGVDNTVSTFGGYIKFRLTIEGPESAPVPDVPGLRILLTDTKVPRNTKAIVAGVAARAAQKPALYSNLFNTIDSVSEACMQAFADYQADVASVSAIPKMAIGDRVVHRHSYARGVIKSLHPTHLKYVVQWDADEDSFAPAIRHRYTNHEFLHPQFQGVQEKPMQKGQRVRVILGKHYGKEGGIDVFSPKRSTIVSDHDGVRLRLYNTDLHVIDTPPAAGGTCAGAGVHNFLDIMQDLMRINQHLLGCIGVSHPAIDTTCRITSEYGLQSKLTGAGGGGCVVTILPSGIVAASVTELQQRLQANNYRCFEVEAGGDGVQLQVLRDGKAGGKAQEAAS
eukprot:jgi/Chlat1/3945/Chrsp26S04200